MTAPSETAPPAAPAFDPIPLLAEELSLPAQAVASVVRLIAEGGTVPFIARYRKEATGGLDEVQIRAIGERFEYVTELEARRGNVIEEIQKQGKLTPELLQRLRAVSTKAELEAAIASDPDWADIPQDWYRHAKPHYPAAMRQEVRLRLDPDLVAWFKRQGPGYGARINAALRAFVEAHGRASGRAGEACSPRRPPP